MEENMRIRFMHPWQRFGRGDETEMDLGVADILCRRGIAEPVESPPERETAALEGGPESAMLGRPKPRKRHA
jgi:hypothetical protein